MCVCVCERAYMGADGCLCVWVDLERVKTSHHVYGFILFSHLHYDNNNVRPII